MESTAADRSQRPSRRRARRVRGGARFLAGALLGATMATFVASRDAGESADDRQLELQRRLAAAAGGPSLAAPGDAAARDHGRAASCAADDELDDLAELAAARDLWPSPADAAALEDASGVADGAAELDAAALADAPAPLEADERAEAAELLALPGFTPELLAAWQELDGGSDFERSLELAVALLAIPDAKLTAKVMQALAKSEPLALVALVDGWLEPGVREARPLAQIEAALKAMGSLGKTRAEALGVPLALDRWFAEGERGPALAAARAAEQLGDGRLVEQWIDRTVPALTAGDPARRVKALQDLGATRSRRALPELLPSLADDDPAVRRAAADALQKLDRATVQATLAELAGSSQNALRAAARAVLADLERQEAEKRARKTKGGRGGR